jgi:hypothetical protein
VLRIRLLAVAAMVAVPVFIPAPSAASPAANVYGPIWTFGPVPPVSGPASLRDVAVLGDTEVWVAGTRSYPPLPLVARWDGGQWVDVGVPSDYNLMSIDAAAGGGVWVAGTTRAEGGTPAPLLARYDGAWHEVPTGLPPGTAGTLAAVEMLTATEGWAVGSVTAAGHGEALILQAVAGTWQRVPLPPGGAASELSAVYAAGYRDVWAVGTRMDANGVRSALGWHWDGTAWYDTLLPEPRAGVQQRLNGVSGAAGEVWAVGETCEPGSGQITCQALTLRWNGRKWLNVANARGAGTDLKDLVVISPEDLWVFGYGEDSDGLVQEHLEHWDGTTFTTVSVRPLPQLDFPAAGLVAAHRIPGTAGLWAVGWLDDRYQGRPFVTRYR